MEAQFVTWAGKGGMRTVARVERALKTQIVVREMWLNDDGTTSESGVARRYGRGEKVFEFVDADRAFELLRERLAAATAAAEKRAAEKREYDEKLARRMAEFGGFAEVLAGVDEFGMGEMRFTKDSGAPVRVIFTIEPDDGWMRASYGYWELRQRSEGQTWEGPSSSTVSFSYEYEPVLDDAGKPVSYEYVVPADAKQRVLAMVVERIATW